MEGLSRQYRMLRYNKRMEAEVAVITAGAGGLGRLIIRRLAQRGFVAVVADSDREANLRLCQAAR
jgi:NAD(P)-dependent dehydrogenase (short-subunit alcohol dehydrogenase family)